MGMFCGEIVTDSGGLMEEKKEKSELYKNEVIYLDAKHFT